MEDPSHCPICLNEPHIPIQLQCNHIFCYLCLKGSSVNHMNCPICRQPYSPTIFFEPDLKQKSITLPAESAKWSYSGRGGFWLFDKITNGYMENAFQNKRPYCEVSIAGNTYVIDFDKMMQFRKDTPGKRRHIKRLIEFDKKEIKGIAGVSSKILKVKVKRNRLNSDSGEGPSSVDQSHEHPVDQDEDSSLEAAGIAVKPEPIDPNDAVHLPVIDSDLLLSTIKKELNVSNDEIAVKIKEEPQW